MIGSPVNVRDMIVSTIEENTSSIPVDYASGACQCHSWIWREKKEGQYRTLGSLIPEMDTWSRGMGVSLVVVPCSAFLIIMVYFSIEARRPSTS